MPPLAGTEPLQSHSCHDDFAGGGKEPVTVLAPWRINPLSLLHLKPHRPHLRPSHISPTSSSFPTARQAAASSGLAMGEGCLDAEQPSGVNIVIKAPGDHRSYRFLHLSNGLTALLVHDPEIFPDGPPEASGAEEMEGMNMSGSEDENEDEDEDEDDDEDDEDEDDDEDDEGEDGDEDDEEEEGKGEGNGRGDDDEEENPVNYPTKKAAAAMCVRLGSFSDPFEAQGLAHFLEHMLFMGSSEYPNENEYDSFLSKHGGSSNAYTETEHTCYYFDVNREHLRGALKRFSQFFISPLIKAEAMEREVLAVDSEFNQALQNDSARVQQLQCHTALSGHPFNKFFWGNKRSLNDATERGVDLREQIWKLYQDNYFGELMKLVIIGGETLDTLSKWVVELFSNVKIGHRLVASPKKIVPIWNSGKLFRLAAVKDIHVLKLSWTLPSLHKDYLKKPEDYLAYLLGHEGRGSLFFFFKEKGWASSLSAGVCEEGTHRCSIAYVFDVSVHLTESGSEKVNEVIGTVYQYLKLLREVGPQAWVFEELRDIGNMEFKYSEEQPQDDYAVELAENLLLYAEEHVIFGQYAFEEWDPKLVEYLLTFFTPDNMRIDFVTNNFNKESVDVQYEPWFGSPYTEENIPPLHLELWRNPQEVNLSIHLPPKNEFIPRNFSVRSQTTVASNKPGYHECPDCLIDEPSMKMWYKLDCTFNVPRANTYFLITVKGGYENVKNCVLTELFTNLLKDALNEVLYQAGVARLETSLSIFGDKLELKLYGFNDKLHTLLVEILNITKSFSPSADRYKVIKEDMERSYKNANMKPLSHSSYLRLQVLRQKFWDVDDKLLCLKNLSFSDLNAFVPDLLSQLFIEGFCHGNLVQNDVYEICNIFKNLFSSRQLDKECRHHESILCLPAGANFIRSTMVKNKLEGNSVVELYFQIEQDVGLETVRLLAVTDLFDKIIEEPFFDQIRTKEQLGYTVESGKRMTYRVLGFCFLVQSSDYGPNYLRERINHFIDSLQDLLDNLDAETIVNYRTGLIEEKLEKDPSLIHETNRHWNQIVDKRYLFEMQKMEVEELKTIEKSDVIGWYQTYLRPDSLKCRRLSVHLWGCNTNFTSETESEFKFGNVIEDLASFKISAKYYPSLC